MAQKTITRKKSAEAAASPYRKRSARKEQNLYILVDCNGKPFIDVNPKTGKEFIHQFENTNSTKAAKKAVKRLISREGQEVEFCILNYNSEVIRRYLGWLERDPKTIQYTDPKTGELVEVRKRYRAAVKALGPVNKAPRKKIALANKLRSETFLGPTAKIISPQRARSVLDEAGRYRVSPRKVKAPGRASGKKKK